MVVPNRAVPCGDKADASYTTRLQSPKKSISWKHLSKNKKITIPARKFIHRNKPFLFVDNSHRDFQYPPSISIAVVFGRTGLEEFPDQHLGRALCFVTANFDRVFRLLERIPFLVAFFQNMFLQPGRHGVKDGFFSLFDFFRRKLRHGYLLLISYSVHVQKW